MDKNLREIIAKATEQEWIKTISISFNFKLSSPFTIKGLTAIYEYIEQQYNGWAKFKKVPSEFNYSINYFQRINIAINKFIYENINQNQYSLNALWRNQIENIINNTNQDILQYHLPEVEFLIQLFDKSPKNFQGAYNYLLNISNNINYSDALTGAIMAYEFSQKDQSNIVNRRNAEKSSISKLKSDFQKYLTESEYQLETHLNDANLKYDEYVKIIDNLKSEKEKLFESWFDETKNKKWNVWYEPVQKKIEELENTYKEKLKLEEPAKYWDERAKRLKSQGWLALGLLIGFIIIICIFLGNILWNPPEIFKTSILSEDKSVAIKWILIYATLLSFLAYGVRALSRTMFSSFHLARDCEERYTLTYFYLSLLKDSKVNDNDRQLIMQSLFSRADTGLLKDDSSPTMPSEIINKIITNK